MNIAHRLIVTSAGAIALSLAACTEGPPAKVLTEADPAIKSADVIGPNINVQLVFEGVGSAASPQSIGSAVRNIGRAIQAGAPGPTNENEWLQVSAMIDGDDFGNLRFPLSRLRTADFETIDGFQTLNLADRAQPGTGNAFQFAVEYCATGNFRAASTEFCRLVQQHRY